MPDVPDHPIAYAALRRARRRRRATVTASPPRRPCWSTRRSGCSTASSSRRRTVHGSSTPIRPARSTPPASTRHSPRSRRRTFPCPMGRLWSKSSRGGRWLIDWAAWSVEGSGRTSAKVESQRGGPPDHRFVDPRVSDGEPVAGYVTSTRAPVVWGAVLRQRASRAPREAFVSSGQRLGRPSDLPLTFHSPRSGPNMCRPIPIPRERRIATTRPYCRHRDRLSIQMCSPSPPSGPKGASAAGRDQRRRRPQRMRCRRCGGA